MPTIAKTRMRIAPRSRSAGAISLAADAMTLIVGLAACESLKLIGTIPGTEVVLIVVFPVLLIVRFKRITQGKLKYLFLFLGLWLVGQIFTDLYRRTAFFDAARGDSAIVFMALDLAALAALLSGNERRKAIFIFGFALGTLLATRLSPNPYFADAPWKFGYSQGVNALVVLVSCWFFARRRYTVVAMLLVGIAGLNLFFDFRSPVLVLLVTIGVSVPVIPERIGRLRILPPLGTGLRIAVLILIALTMGITAKLVTTGLAASGALGEEAQQKNEIQSNSTLGLLLGGRPEILISSRAVIDSPILGHGSYAKDLKYTEMYHDLMIETSVESEDASNEQTEAYLGNIPAHSALMQAWVYGGVLGAAFWGYVFVLVMRGLVRATVLRPALLPAYSFFFVAFAWAILFSPFGFTERINDAFLLVTICDLLNSAPSPASRSVSHMRRRRLFTTKNPLRPSTIRKWALNTFLPG